MIWGKYYVFFYSLKFINILTFNGLITCIDVHILMKCTSVHTVILNFNNKSYARYFPVNKNNTITR